MIAGQITQLIQLHPAASESMTYKAITRIPCNDHGFEGGKVSVTLPYKTNAEHYAEITEIDIEEQYAVYFRKFIN